MAAVAATVGCGLLRLGLQRVGVRALILAPRCKTSDYVAMVREVAPRVPPLEHAICLGNERPEGMLSFDELLVSPDAVELSALHAHAAPVRNTDAINIQCTSGTTGAPKGATLSHRNLLNNAFFVGAAMRLTAEYRLCIPVPLQDVQVIGVPDARYGGEVCACIILRPGETASVNEIRDFCSGQIARYKIPRYGISRRRDVEVC